MSKVSNLKQQYRDKLHWLEMGIPLSDSPDKNPNENVFSLAMYWEDVELILIRLAELEAIIETAGGADELLLKSASKPANLTGVPIYDDSTGEKIAASGIFAEDEMGPYEVEFKTGPDEPRK